VVNVRPELVIVDGLRSLEAFTGGAQGLHHFIYGLTSWFAVEGITLILTRDSSPSEMWSSPEHSLVDGVLVLQPYLVNGRLLRRLLVQKTRGQMHLPGLHSFTIDEHGITIWPRPQTTYLPADRPWSEARAPFGVPSLDAMLGGGLPQASATLLAADPGADGTALGLSFLAAGAEQGEPGLWVGFGAPHARLLGMAQHLGIDLAGPEARRQVSFLVVAPFELVADEFADRIRRQVADIGARRMVLDGAEVLESALPGRAEARSFMAWLLQALPQQGVTTLVTRQTSQGPGQSLLYAGEGLASLAENVILIRHVRRQGELRRALAILKMSSPGYDRSVRELVLERGGLHVDAPLGGEVGLPGSRAIGE
ncbi:MAG: ATPase domain-containing protein, partial [Anaerolineae bacterium]|nr:ATPase domain-containing protein [Anaerolineae bacterium]